MLNNKIAKLINEQVIKNYIRDIFILILQIITQGKDLTVSLIGTRCRRRKNATML